jgi:hypothetical protein
MVHWFSIAFVAWLLAENAYIAPQARTMIQASLTKLFPLSISVLSGVTLRVLRRITQNDPSLVRTINQIVFFSSQGDLVEHTDFSSPYLRAVIPRRHRRTLSEGLQFIGRCERSMDEFRDAGRHHEMGGLRMVGRGGRV